MHPLRTRIVVVALAAAIAGGLAGCNSNKTSKADQVRSEYGPDEFVTLPPETGSHIPKKVKVKDALSNSGSTKSKTEEIDTDTFLRTVRPSTVKPES